MGGSTGKRLLAKVAEDFEVKVFECGGLSDALKKSLDSTGKIEKKKCTLTALFTFYFLIMMSLHRDKGYSQVMKKLINIVRDKLPPDEELELKPVCNEAPIKARQRLGIEPVKDCFETRAEEIKPERSFFGFRPWGIDGVNFTMPDTEANEGRFGRPGSSRGDAAFPQVRMVPLVCTDTHRIRGAVFGKGKMAERPACSELLQFLGEGDVLFIDRGFAAVWLFKEILDKGIQIVARIPNNWTFRRAERLGPGDHMVTIARREDIPSGERLEGGPKTRVTTLKMRLIEFKTKDSEEVRLLTSLFDPEMYPARELAVGYHTRWETEITYDELKTHFFTVKHGTLHTNFRSQNPDDVLQECYGMLLTYNLVRSLIAEAASGHNIPPLEISFVESLEVIQEAIPRFELSPPCLHAALTQRLLRDLAACRLDRPRRKRCNPRKVKTKMSNFGRKRSGDRGSYRDFQAEIELLDVAA